MLVFLYNKYKLGSLTESERKTFMSLVRQPEMEETLKKLIDSEFQSIEAQNMPAELIQSEEKALKILTQILAKKEVPAKHSIRKIIGHHWLKYAAVILLAIPISISFWQKKNKKNEMDVLVTSQKGPSTNEVKSGGKRVTLKLADGSIINLDSATNGFLSQEGNASVIKQKDGELVYRLNNNNRIATVYNTLSTPNGMVFRLTLPDGTKVWLNAASSIRYPTVFSLNERKVEVSGEAYFEVVHNPSKPFRVTINNRAEVEVLGTHFNVNSYDEEKEMKVTLLEGKVRLSPIGSGEVVSAKSKILLPGQQGKLSNSLKHELFTIDDNVDIDEVMAWTKGEFRFNNMPVDYLLRQAARWYDVEFEYQLDPSNINLSGLITRKDNISNFLEVITATRKVQFVLKGRKIIVEPYKEK